MLKLSRFHRSARGLLLLGICLLILSALPARPTSAAIIPLQLDNSLDQFARGKFQRTSLSAVQGSSPDTAGAVQLLPAGTLKDWAQTAYNLPKKLTDVSAVHIGTHIFVIGGLTGSGTSRGPVADVWSATIDPNTGAPILNNSVYWSAELKLPAVAAADVTTGTLTIAPRSATAVAAVETGPDSGFIYVIGGLIQPNPSTTLSSYAVNIGTVTNGHIASWATGPKIPSTEYGYVGLRSASAVSFATGGKTYIYLIGGLQRFKQGLSFFEAGSKQVYYAQVGGNGQLSKPSGGTGADAVWATLSALPVPALSQYVGLWDATAVAGNFDDNGNGLYVMGGQFQSNVGHSTTPNTYSSAVYRAIINSNGTIAWQQDNPIPTLPEPRVGLSGAEFNGRLYLTGGQPASTSVGEPQRGVLSSYIQDDLKVAQIGQGSSFKSSDGTLTIERAHHATVVVNAIPSPESPNPAYIYVIAGRGIKSNIDTDGSDTLIMGKIGTADETLLDGFALSGWYYSKSHNLTSTVAQVQEIDWTAIITHPNDIQLQYRTSTAQDCDDPNAYNTSQWSAILDGDTANQAYYSKNGPNIAPNLQLPPSHCFQYRAKLLNVSDGSLLTPSLMNISIKVQLPGFPDLKVQTLQVQKDTGGSLTGLLVQIQNQNNVEPTQPANLYGSDHGSFFVDMFVFPPGTTPTTPTLPLYMNGNNPASKACASITKDKMGINATLTISQWYDSNTDATCATQPKDLLSLFTVGGHYVVIVAVDSDGCTSHGCVDEASPNGEKNNLRRIEFDLPVAGPVKRTVLLPMIAR